jgi:hypothetical protein
VKASNKVAQMMTLQFQNRQLPVLKDLEKQARQRIATYTRQLNEIETSGDDLQGLEDLDVHVLELTECKLADQQQHRAVEQLIETAEKGVIGAEEMETFNQLLATSKRLKKTARSKAKLEQIRQEEMLRWRDISRRNKPLVDHLRARETAAVSRCQDLGATVLTLKVMVGQYPDNEVAQSELSSLQRQLREEGQAVGMLKEMIAKAQKGELNTDLDALNQFWSSGRPVSELKGLLDGGQRLQHTMTGLKAAQNPVMMISPKYVQRAQQNVSLLRNVLTAVQEVRSRKERHQDTSHGKCGDKMSDLAVSIEGVVLKVLNTSDTGTVVRDEDVADHLLKDYGDTLALALAEHDSAKDPFGRLSPMPAARTRQLVRRAVADLHSVISPVAHTMGLRHEAVVDPKTHQLPVLSHHRKQELAGQGVVLGSEHFDLNKKHSERGGGRMAAESRSLRSFPTVEEPGASLPSPTFTSPVTSPAVSRPLAYSQMFTDTQRHALHSRMSGPPYLHQIPQRRKPKHRTSQFSYADAFADVAMSEHYQHLGLTKRFKNKAREVAYCERDLQMLRDKRKLRLWRLQLSEAYNVQEMERKRQGAQAKYKMRCQDDWQLATTGYGIITKPPTPNYTNTQYIY